jgi:hypothetical protein
VVVVFFCTASSVFCVFVQSSATIRIRTILHGVERLVHASNNSNELRETSRAAVNAIAQAKKAKSLQNLVAMVSVTLLVVNMVQRFLLTDHLMSEAQAT